MWTELNVLYDTLKAKSFFNHIVPTESSEMDKKLRITLAIYYFESLDSFICSKHFIVVSFLKTFNNYFKMFWRGLFV